MRQYAGKYRDDPEQEQRLELMRLCERTGKSYSRTLRLIQDITTGALSHREALGMVRRSVLYEAAIAEATRKIARLEKIAARCGDLEAWCFESDAERQAFTAWMLTG